MACNWTNPSTCVADAASQGIKGLADAFAEGATWAVKEMTTAWMKIPSPNLMLGDSPVAWFSDRLVYFVWVAVFCSVLVAAYRLATSGDHRHGLALGKSLMRLFIVSGTLAILTTLCLSVGDSVADWLLGQVTLSKTSAVLVAGLASGAGMPDALRFVLAGVVILAQLIQMGLMLLKDAVVIALVAFIPLTAAVTNTERGFAGYERAITWLGAFVLYKPVAAALYALAFLLFDPKSGLIGMLSGVVLMLLAIFALPAMIKLLAPAAAAASGGNAGAIAGATVGAALATGAVVATGGISGGFAGASSAAGGAGAGGAGGAGPTGAALVSSIPPPSGSGPVSQQTEEAVAS